MILVSEDHLARLSFGEVGEILVDQRLQQRQSVHDIGDTVVDHPEGGTGGHDDETTGDEEHDFEAGGPVVGPSRQA